jgi:hypothetical protein
VRVSLAVVLLLCSAVWAGEKPAPDLEAQKAYQTGIYAHYMAPGKATIPNQQLVDIMWEITLKQYNEAPAEEKKLPEGTTEEEFLKKLKARVATFPCVQVTAEDDEKFKAGTFNDTQNFIAFMDFTKILKENNVPTPFAIQVLQGEQKKGGLKGARLELGVRFAFMIISKLYRSAEKK